MSDGKTLPVWRSRPAFSGGEYVFRGGETYSEGEGIAPCFHVDLEEAEPVVAYLNALEERAGLAAEMAEYLAKVAISNLYKVVFDVPWHLNWLTRYDAIKAKEAEGELMELPADYKRIESYYSRPGLLWLWCCDRLIHYMPMWSLRWSGLYFAQRAYTWSLIQTERLLAKRGWGDE